MVCCSGNKQQGYHQMVRKSVALLETHKTLENLDLALVCATFVASLTSNHAFQIFRTTSQNTEEF